MNAELKAAQEARVARRGAQQQQKNNRSNCKDSEPTTQKRPRMSNDIGMKDRLPLGTFACGQRIFRNRLHAGETWEEEPPHHVSWGRTIVDTREQLRKDLSDVLASLDSESKN